MTTKLILAISGWKQSGKDTAGDSIVDTFGFHRLALADALKHNTAVQYGLPRSMFYDQELKERAILQLPAIGMIDEEYPPSDLVEVDGKEYWTPRALLIHEGGMKRLVDPDYWVRTMFTSLFAAEQVGQSLFVITDLRFENEVDAMKRIYSEYEIITLRINRFVSTDSYDCSERDLDNYDFDHVIDNKGTQEDFLARINELTGGLLNERR